MLRALLPLIAIGALCGALLMGTDKLTAARIATNERQFSQAQLAALIGFVPADEPAWRQNAWQVCDGPLVVRLSEPGYGGTVAALLAVQEHKLLGLRVTAHQETPGIADFVDRPADPWRASLRGRNATQLANLDGVVGATITSRTLLRLASRAVVHAPVEGCSR